MTFSPFHLNSLNKLTEKLVQIDFGFMKKCIKSWLNFDPTHFQVSAIYEDTSLEANLRLVVSRLVFYEDRKQGQVTFVTN